MRCPPLSKGSSNGLRRCSGAFSHQFCKAASIISLYPSYGYNGYYGRDDYEPATINGSNWGARNGSWKKDEPKQSVLPPKEEKKESAGSVNNAGDKSEPLDGQNSLNLPPYVEDNEEPWWKTGRSVS